MPRRLFDSVDNWLGGVITTGSSDKLPAAAFAGGRNTELRRVTRDRASVGTRKGAAVVFDSPLTDEPTIIGHLFYKPSNGDAKHLLVGNDGSLWFRDPADDTPTLIDASAFTPTDSTLPTFAQANNLAFIATGTENKKYNGTDLQEWGIAAPENAPTFTQPPVLGSTIDGTWDAFFTYVNSNTGAESSRGPSASVTVTLGNRLVIALPTPPDSQVTHINTYVRRQSVGSNYYRLSQSAVGAGNTSIGANSTFSSLSILPPGVTEHFQPPTGAKSPTIHKSRMFVHDGTGIYYTPVEEFEHFDSTNAYEPVNPDDGQQIVGLLSAHDRLIIFKERSIYALVGDDPETWSFEEVATDVGAVGQQSIVHTGGVTFFWDPIKGPMRWRGGGSPEDIGTALIAPTVDRDLLNVDKLHFTLTAVDETPQSSRVLFAVPEFGKSRPSVIFPFHLHANAWESEGWDPFDISSMAVAEDEDGASWIYMGGLYGQLFQWGSAANDGVPEGAVSSGLITAATDTTLTGTDAEDASPAWTVNSLKGRYVYAISSDESEVQRRLIVSNTADQLTVDTVWSTNPNNTYTFVIGGINFSLDTSWRMADLPFHNKRHEFIFAQAESDEPGTVVQMDLFLDYDLTEPAKTKAFTVAASAVYDTAVYDTDRFFSSSRTKWKFRVARTSPAWRARIRFVSDAQDLTVHVVSMQSVLLSTKS